MATDFARNDLETALVAATQDAAARPRFYETLLRSQVFVLDHGEAPITVDGSGVAPEGTTRALRGIDVDGTPHVPFFSSPARMPPGTRFLGIGCQVFLRMTSGTHLALNPGSPYGKYFNPDEVASLLDGSLLRPVEKVTLEKAEQQLIGQPADYPHGFAQAVARYVATETAVTRAFLAQHFIASVHEQPTLLVAIEMPEEGFDRVSAAVGVIAKDPSGPRRAVDVMRVDKTAPGYYAGIEPIYTRQRKGFIARLFG
jgi:SseB protein C-terminal domain/SseB protein N-terminal domain